MDLLSAARDFGFLAVEFDNRLGGKRFFTQRFIPTESRLTRRPKAPKPAETRRLSSVEAAGFPSA
jgi:hypothetical protein